MEKRTFSSLRPRTVSMQARLAGRVFELFAKFDFLLVKAGEVVAAGVLDRRMKRRERLDDDFAFDIAASGAPGDLGEELEGAFARAEIRHVQAEVGVDDADQRDVRKMQALGDHLRADQDVDFAGAKIAEDAAVIVLALQRVGIHAGDARVREKFLRASPRLFPCRGRSNGCAGCGILGPGKPRGAWRRGRRCGSRVFGRCDGR